MLEKVSISGGFGGFVSGGGVIGLGNCHIPLHVSRNQYTSKLYWISTKYVLLWDEEEKTGWLVSGTTALLHLVRASLEHSRTDKLSSAFLFRPTQMTEASVTHSPNAAIQVLLNRDNLTLRLYPDREVIK